MRHAFIRLWKLSGFDVKWFVPEGHPAIFDITKRKIHNVLQGVAEEGVEMTDEDKKNFEIWTEQNCRAPPNALLILDEHFWTNGAIDSGLIVIDDPQCKCDSKRRADRQWHPSYPSSRRRGQTLKSSSGHISKVGAPSWLELIDSPIRLD
jgi:hypothetical protein